ncbi:ABC transporter permease [Streptomyces sp. NPDC057460]|uniref:ABC transporter permease n=1 Tax=Streptomyces sp. NPDC057460 TaxID=3346141 RepID=UPI0036BE0C3F
MVLSVVRRVGRSLLVILLVSIGVTLLLGLAPGSAAEVVLGPNATPDAVAALESKLGLDQPLWAQYGHWLAAAVRGDLGESPVTGQSVSAAIVERLPITLELAGLALLLSLAVAILLATVSAGRPGGSVDRAANGLSSVFLSIPAFIAGPVLIYVFAVQAGWLPVTGWARVGEEGMGAHLRSAALPVVAIALTEIAAFHRLLRSDLVGTLREDFIEAARAKGLGRGYVMFRHALRPSSFSLVTLAGLSLGRLIGGTVVVESLFSLPGLGQLMASAIVQRDVVMVQGVVVFVAGVYVVVNTLVDLSYQFIDPRVRKVARV